MTIHLIAYVLIPVWIYLSFKDIKTIAYAYILCAPLQTVSVFNVGGSSVMFYHLIFLTLLIKYIVRVLKQRKMSVNLPLDFMLFLVWSFITIPLAVFNTDEVVYKVSGGYGNVAFSFQQFTQFAYLLMNFLVCIILSDLLADNVIDMKGVKKVINYGFIMVMVLAIIQMFVSPKICTLLYRNSINATYLNNLRISGPFQEPSMLALYAAPLCGIYLSKVFYHQDFRYILHILLFMIVLMQNRASSSIVGLAIVTLIFLISAVYQFVIKKNVKLLDKNKTYMLAAATLVVAAIMTIVYGNKISAMISLVGSKFAGNGISGSERTYMVQYHLEIFSRHWLAGIGYGTLRSLDLLSTMLCSGGIIGFMLYVIPVLRSSLRIFFNMSNRAVMLYVIVYNAIMFISVTEIALPYVWIAYAIMFYVLTDNGSQRRYTIEF